MSDHIVRLQRSRRFDAEGGVGALAEAALRGDTARALAMLSAGAGGIRWTPDERYRITIETLAAGYLPLMHAAQAADPPKALALAHRFAVLCAHRGGAYGSVELNRAIERSLRRQAAVGVRGEWYPGRVVMMGRNDYGLQLFNGEIGVALRDADGGLSVYFTPAEDGARRFAPARLSGCETAFALTVHKAQGSEFDEVALVLPQQVSPVLSRELFYTAVTRARRGLHVFGDADMIRATLERCVARDSALGARLR